MDIKNLIKNPLINISALAAELYPGMSRISAKTKLHNKLLRYQGREFSPEELKQLEQIWLNMKLAIDGYVEGEFVYAIDEGTGLPDPHTEITFKPKAGGKWKIAGFTRIE